MNIAFHSDQTTTPRDLNHAGAPRALARIALFAAAALAVQAHAAVTFTSFEQHTRGWARVNPAGVPDIVDSYDLSPANPAATWLPPNQRINISTPVESSYVDFTTRYAAVITPTALDVRIGLTGDNGTLFGNEYTYDQLFTSAFTVDDPTEINFFAYASYETGWGGGVQRIALLNETTGAPVFESTIMYPITREWLLVPTTLTLPAGAYRVTIANSGGWGGRGDNRRVNLEFRMIVPAPGSVPIVAVAVLLAARRRRDRPLR